MVCGKVEWCLCSLTPVTWCVCARVHVGVCAHPHAAFKRAERTPDLSSVRPQAFSEHAHSPPSYEQCPVWKVNTPQQSWHLCGVTWISTCTTYSAT